jgi:hypothetical protein
MCEVIDHVLTTHMAQDIWDEINTMFGTITYARMVNTNIAIATTKELLGIVRVRCEDEGLRRQDNVRGGRFSRVRTWVYYIIDGLNDKYDIMVATVIARETIFTVSDLLDHGCALSRARTPCVRKQ